MENRAENVIIDTLYPMRRFLKDTGFFVDLMLEVDRAAMEEYLDQVLDRLVDCVAHSTQAHSRLWDYANELRDESFLSNSSESNRKLSQAVVELGDTLTDHLQTLGAYDDTKQLRYYYSGRIAHADLILTRI